MPCGEARGGGTVPPNLLGPAISNEYSCSFEEINERPLLEDVRSLGGKLDSGGMSKRIDSFALFRSALRSCHLLFSESIHLCSCSEGVGLRCGISDRSPVKAESEVEGRIDRSTLEEMSVGYL